ncbi:MAG: hypothetical protein J0I32_10925 [Sphingobacteriales bacterium]|nr:hypothetical protein [Sphingobacteriales bacterium]
MKTIVCTIACISLAYLGKTQMSDVVIWGFSTNKIGDKTYEVHFTPVVQSPWHIYSQTSPEGGALPTSISFNKNPLAVIDGNPKEVGKIVSKYEDVFGVTVKYFDGKADFVQTVKVRSNVKTNISGSIEFMICNDEECLPPQTVSFNIPLQ